MRGERRGRRKRRKERDGTVKNWNIEREIVEDEKPSLIYIHTLLFYIYIYTRVTWIHYVEGDVHILGQHFHSIGFTRFFPRFPRFFAMPRLFRERILGCPYKFLVCGS